MTQPINIRPEADLVAAIVQHARKAGFSGISKRYDTPSRSAAKKALSTLKCHLKTLRLAASPEAALAATALQELIERRTSTILAPAKPTTHCTNCGGTHDVGTICPKNTEL